MSRLDASYASAAAAPVTIGLLGYDVPVLAAIASLIAVVLASMIAPPPPRPLKLPQRVALIGLLCLLMLGLVIADPERSILLTTCWAIGIGFTGLPLIEEIQRRIFARTGELTGAPAPEDDSHADS